MKRIGIVLLLCLCFTMWASAAEEESNTILQEQYTNSGLAEVYDSLDGAAKEILERWGIDSSGAFTGEGLSLRGIWDVLMELLAASVTNPISAGTAGMGVLLLCSFAGTLFPEKNQGMIGIMHYFSALCLITAVLIPAGYTLSKAASAIATLGNFMIAFIPVFAGILIGIGRTLTAGGACTLVFGCSQLVVYLSKSFLVPLIGMFLALAVCETTTIGTQTSNFTSAFKRITVWVLGLSTTVFTGLLCLTGIINGAGDSMAQRTTRFFIGNMVPVIGGTLSETLATVQGCFSLLKTGGGVLGIGAVLAILLPILVEILLWRGLIMLLTTASQLMGENSVSRLLQALGDGMGLLLSVVLCCLIVYTVSLSVLMLAGGGAA